ncbi:MAG: hypothetical protein HXS46_03965 [Theionarchaea archaeon]|nr:hypothetical protein [Theionarchaea archaeon]
MDNQKWLTKKRIAAIVLMAVLVVIPAILATISILSYTIFAPEEVLMVESAELYGSKVWVCVRNTTTGTVFLASEYKNGTLVTHTKTLSVPPRGRARFMLSGAYAPGDQVKLVTREGDQIIFEVQ